MGPLILFITDQLPHLSFCALLINTGFQPGGEERYRNFNDFNRLLKQPKLLKQFLHAALT